MITANSYYVDAPPVDFGFGLVTYSWGQNLDLEQLIAICEASGLRSLELRTDHAHGVEYSLNVEQRQAVADRFANTEVVLAGLGSGERFDVPDKAVLTTAIERAKKFIQLSHDVGGSGVKVKPGNFHSQIPREKTIEQIGKTLNILAAFGEGFDQEIRVEIQGSCAELPVIKSIMDIADHPNAKVCWNCNPQDLIGEGLEHNFGLVRRRFGNTLHVKELDDESYPFQQLFDLLVQTEYVGWVLLEARKPIEDLGAALINQRELFEKMAKQALANADAATNEQSDQGDKANPQPDAEKIEAGKPDGVENADDVPKGQTVPAGEPSPQTNAEN